MIRTPGGYINNCAIANSDEEKNCQVCGGVCPDRDRIVGAASLDDARHVFRAKEENPDFEVFAPAVIPDESVSHFLEQWLRAPSAGSIFYVILGDGQRYEIRMRKA